MPGEGGEGRGKALGGAGGKEEAEVEAVESGGHSEAEERGPND